MVTSQWEGRGMQEGGGGRLRCTRAEAESKRLSGRVRGCSYVWERKGEREKQWWWSTPGCHHSVAASGCNKKHRITSLTPCSAFFLSLRLSYQTRAPLAALQRLCWDWAGIGSSSLVAINKLGLDGHSHERETLDLQLTIWGNIIAVERKQKGKKKKKKKGRGGSVRWSRSGCNWST